MPSLDDITLAIQNAIHEVLRTSELDDSGILITGVDMVTSYDINIIDEDGKHKTVYGYYFSDATASTILGLAHRGLLHAKHNLKEIVEDS